MADTPVDLGTRYQEIALLGEGGMGRVYLVEDTTTGTHVALKVLAGQTGMDANAFLQFKQEFRVMAKLKHENTCGVYDYGLLPDGSPYITMELVPGKGLDELIPLQPDKLKGILPQIAKALGYVHQQGFVHCDIKPENIRVRPDGTVKLMDFGLMQPSGQAGGQIKGTLAYMAPEVAKRDVVDPRADLYSLGAVTYQLLAGSAPFVGKTPVEVLRAHIGQAPAPLRAQAPSVSAELEGVVFRLLAKEPQARFASAVELLAALGEPVDDAAAAGVLSPAFIGRQAPAERLNRAVAAIKRGEGFTRLHAAAPAGMGKSRLVTEFRFAAQLAEVPFVVSAAGAAPYAAVAGWLRGLYPLARERAAGLVAELAPLLARIVPELTGPTAALALEPEQEKNLLQMGLADLVAASLAPSGGVLVAEDLDRWDALSLEVLPAIARKCAGLPVLLFSTARGGEAPAEAEALDLPPFDAAETGKMAASMLGLPPESVPAGLAEDLRALTHGTPGFIADVLTHLVSSGALTRAKGQWVLPEALPEDAVPRDAKALVAQRFAELDPTSRDVALWLAVFGEPAGLATLEAVTGLGEDALFDALEALTALGWLSPDAADGTRALAGSDLAAALLETLGGAEKASRHERIALRLESELPEAPTLAQRTALARHFLETSHDEQAARYAFEAGEANRKVFAQDIAASLLEPALARLDRLGEPERHASLRAEILFSLASVKGFQHDVPKALACIEEAAAIAEGLGDEPRLLDLRVQQAHLCSLSGGGAKLQEAIGLLQGLLPLAARLLTTTSGEARARVARSRARLGFMLGRSHFFTGQNAQALEAFRENERVARDEAQPYWLGRTLTFLGFLLVQTGTDRPGGYALLEEAVALQEGIKDLYGKGYSYNMLVHLQLHSGRFAEALEACRDYGKTMQDLGARDDYLVALLNRAIAHYELGDLEAASEVAEDALAQAKAVSHATVQPIAQAILGAVRLWRGDAEAAGLIEEAFEGAKTANPYAASEVVNMMIEARVHQGRLHDALAGAQEARDLVASTGNTDIETRLWVALGEIHGRLGEYPAARSSFEKAIAKASEADERHILARAHRGLAWLLLAEGKPARAREHLDAARRLASECAMRLTSLQAALLEGELALAEKRGADAATAFRLAIAESEALGVPALAAVAWHGLARAETAPDAVRAALDAGKAHLETLLAPLTPEARADFLTFMERAQLHRDEGPKPVNTPAPQAAGAAPLPGIGHPAAPAFSLPALPVGEPASLAALAAQGAAAQAAAAAAWAALSQALASGAPLGTGGPVGAAGGPDASSERVAQLETRLARQERILQFSNAVHNVDDLEAVLEQAVDLIVEIAGAERGFLLFYENGQIKSRVSRVNVANRGPMDWQFSKSIAEKVLKTGEPVCVFDALADSEFNQAQSVVDLNLRTVICVPMKFQDRQVGAIYVDRQSISENFTEADLDVLLGLAAQAASAIENARIHREWVDKSKRLEMLNNLSKTISGSLEMEEVLDTIVKMTLEVSRAERGFLFLIDDATKALTCRAARDLKSSLPLDADHEISMSVCNKVLASGRAENVADAMNDEEFQFQQSIMALNLRMVMCVPIAAKGQVIGLLYVDSQAVVNAFGEKDLELLGAIAGHASVAIENAKLHAKTQKLAEDLQKTFYSFVQALSASVDAKHPLTAGHSFRVTEYSVRLARKLGLPEEEVENIRIAAILHDVGKIGTPDHILMKPGGFTNEEYEIMKQHVVHTREILDTIYFPERQRHIPEMAGAHHEKWDGSGYPNKTSGTEIPYGGRIMALGDVFDAVTSKRDYREAMPLEKALGIIRSGAGSHFDPDLAPVFVEMIEQEGLSYYDKDPHNPPPEGYKTTAEAVVPQASPAGQPV